MPSAEETTYLIEVMPDAGISQDSFTSRDVDVLVSRIKENLRLSGFKSRSSLAHKMRASPYRLPSRSWADPSTCELCSVRNNSTNEPEQQHQHQHQHQHQQHQRQSQHVHHYRRCRKASLMRSELDDSYERFQALLRKGALIKEAVKRLQTSPEDNDDDDDEVVDEEEEEEEEEDDDDESKRRATSTSATSTTLDSMDDDEDDVDEIVRRRRTRENDDDFFYRRKRFYYDSEDEPLPPVYQPLDL